MWYKVKKIRVGTQQVRPVLKWIPWADTIAYWELNGNWNDTKNNYGVTTYTTTNYNSDGLIWTAPTYTTTRKGKACAKFSGNWILQLPNLPIASNHITVSLWYNKTGNSDWACIFQLKEDTSTDSWNRAIVISDTNSGIQVSVVMTTYSTGVSWQVAYNTSAKTVSTNEWHNYVITFNSWTLKFYVDWVLFDTKSNSSRPYLRNSSSSPSYIWGWVKHYNSYQYKCLNWYMQDVIYENKTWGDQEVLNYYNLTK